MHQLVSLITLSLFLTSLAWAAPALLSYQGRILRADGTALKHNNMSFRFQITNTSGSCIIYEEQIDGYDMSTSNGLFDVAVGSGTRNYPTSGSMTIIGSLNDLGSYTCKDGSSYTSNLSEGRKLRVQFYDGVAWSTITPYMDIRTVPYAGYAKSAAQLGGIDASSYLLKSQIPTCGTTSMLLWSGTAFSCEALPAGGAESDPTVAAFSKKVPSSDFSTPSDVLTLNTVSILKGGTGATTATGALNALLPSQSGQAGKILKTDGTNATWDTAPTSGGVSSVDVAVPFMTSSGAVTSSGVVSMTLNSQAQNLVLAAPLSASGAPSFRALQIADVKSSAGGAFLTGGGCDPGEALVYTSANDTISCQAVAASGFSGSLAGDVSGAQGTTSVDKIKGTPVTVTALATDDFLKYSGGAWVNSKISLADLPVSVSGSLWSASGGNVSRATGRVGVGTSSPQAAFHVAGPADGDLIIESGSATGGNAGFSLISKSSGGVANYTNIIADWSGNLVFRGATGSYTFRSSTNTSLFHIAPNGNVGIGTVAAPAAKLDVNGSIRAQEICDETGANCKDISTGWASGGGGTGTVTEVTATGPLSVTNGTSTPALTIAQATTSTSGYVSSTDWNTFNDKLSAAAAFVGDVTGIYNATTIANNAVTTGKILDGTITGADLNFTGLNTATTSFVMKDSTGSFYNFACSTTGHVPTWTASGFVCQAPSVTETDPQVGANTLNYLSKWNGSALITSGVFEDGGKIGIGTTTPDAQLDVRGPSAWSEIKTSHGPGGISSFISQVDGSRGAYLSTYGSGLSNAMVDGTGLGGASHLYTMASSSKLIIGTSSAVPLHLATNDSVRATIDSSGNLGVGTSTPAAKLDVAGSVHISGQIKSGFLAHSSSTVDWNSGNTQTTTAAAGTLTFTAGTMLDGGNYTLVLKSAGTFTLGTAGDITVWKCNPACTSNQIVATGETVLTIIKAGNTGYVSWITDF